MTPEEVSEVRRRLLLDPADDIDVFARHVNEDVRALLADVRQLTEDRDRLAAKITDFETGRAYRKIGDENRRLAFEVAQVNGILEGGKKDIEKLVDQLIEAKHDRDRARDAAVAAQDRANAAEAKLHQVALLKVWTNEDGKNFVFADELHAAVHGGAS